jgi:nicotinamidase-related amidase
VRLVDAARAASVPVVHCLAVRRSDDKGSNTNARLFTATRKLGIDLAPGSPGAALLPEVAGHDEDLVLQRLHGVGPMGGTDLDAVLRNLGIRTVVVTGVSVNIAVTNCVMDCVNLGYDVVLPRDAVCGVPTEYAESMIDNTLSLLATIVTTHDLIARWGG